MTTAAEALELAEAEVARVIEAGETELHLSRDTVFKALEELPSNIRFAKDVVLLNLNQSSIENIDDLSTLTQLQDVWLNSTYIHDISALSKLTNLQWLGLNDTNVDNVDSLAKSYQLVGLYLSDTAVKSLDKLSELGNLQYINLEGTQVDDISFASKMINLQSLLLDRSMINNLRPICDYIAFENVSELELDGGVEFSNTPATRADKELDRLSKISDGIERTQETLNYLKSLKSWPPINLDSIKAPVQDNVLKVDFINGKYDVLPSKVSEAEADEPLKQKLLQALREAVERLATLAGNYHPALADAARRLAGHLKPDLHDLDLVDIHLTLDSLRGTCERRAERKGEDIFGPDVVGALQEVINIGPGLVLANEDVELLEARRRSYNDNPISPDQITANQNISNAIVNEPELFGERAVAISTATAGEVPEPDNRSWVARTVLNKNAIIIVLSNVALETATTALGLDGLMGMTYAWVVEVAPSLLMLSEGWGQSAVAWATPIINQAREAVEAAKALKKPNS